MPTLTRLPDCSIHMYAGDHLPPHVHIRMRDGREVLVEISSLRVLRGKVPARELQGALTWVLDQHSTLLTQWEQLNP